jgi:hypothetical protein
MASQAFVVLYTKQLTRKLKTYNDGYLIRDGLRARLLDDTGNELACCRWPPSLELNATSEGIACFDGFLVDCDGELASLAEVPRQRPGCVTAPQPSACDSSGAAGSPSPEQQTVAPGDALTGARGKFKPPRMAAPPPPPPPQPACDPQPAPAAHGWLRSRQADASLLGKRWQTDQQEAPVVVAAHQQAPPPVQRSGATLHELL